MSAILLLIALLAAGHIKTGEACNQKMDVCYVLDGSSTVCGGDETCENWESALQFYKNITTTLAIGAIFDRVAFATFTNTTEVKWNLNNYTSMNPLLSAIGGVAFEGGEFYDLGSPQVVVTQVFSPAAGDDVDLPLLPARKNVILMITDGVPSLNETTAELISSGVQRYGITTFVICITSTAGCTDSWAKAVAAKPEKADLITHFLVETYSKLYTVKDTVLENICYFLENPPTPTPTPLVKIDVNLTIG